MKALVTGAAGFIGSHLAVRLLNDGAHVVGIDNLSRPGAAQNLAMLVGAGDSFAFTRTDICDSEAVNEVLRANLDVDLIVHAAGQVAVTTSVANPRADFDANVVGTFNVLEATRLSAPRAALIYLSTNKVYGGLESMAICEQDGRYQFEAAPHGVSELQPLDFHSPYGCSKGAADQYVRDYARIYGLRTVVLRQSCIYGPRQFGVEDQGWVAWFVIGAVLGRRLTVYGDGKQMRDVLWVDDLLDLYLRAYERIDSVAGQVFNVGGGPLSTLSLRELVQLLQEKLGPHVQPQSGEWRPGDQRVFVSDISKVSRALDWRPTVKPAEGVARLIEWAKASKDLLREVLPEADTLANSSDHGRIRATGNARTMSS
jgi:CDP-paratose 2-epimerase